MEYIAITFRSRAHTVRFSEFLRANGVSNMVINTPKEAGVGCGLSVKVSIDNLARIKRALKMNPLGSFAGVFLVRVSGEKRTVRSL